MKKFLLCVCTAAALPLVANADYRMWTEDRYGDSMGSSTGITKQTYSFYDENDLLVRKVQNGMQLDGNWTPDYIYIYEYSDGQLQRYYYRQWQAVYDRWSAAKDSTVYTYDEQGRLIEEVLWWRTTPTVYRDINTYTWEGENMVSHKYEIDNNGNRSTSWTRTYSDFVEGVANLPQKEESVGQYASNTYTKTYTYDDQYHVTLIEQVDADGNPTGKEEYTYDDKGICTSKVVYSYSNGAYVNKSKVERNALGNDQYGRYEYSWSSSNSEWSVNGVHYVETYVESDGTSSPRNMTIENAVSAENPVAVKIACDEPAYPVAGAQYALWRDWEPVDTVAAANGKVEFLDVKATLGVHTYYVQTIDDALGYGISTPQDFVVEIDLPAISNLRALGGYKGTFEDPQSGTYDTYYLKLAWDAPKTELEVLHYEIYEQGFGIPIVVTEDNATTYDFSVAVGNSVTIRVDAVYEYGVSEGEFVTLNFNREADYETVNAMTQKDTYGDVMGFTGKSGISYYLYNDENKIIREYAVGVGYDGVITPEHRYYYMYDENGNLSETYNYQYVATAGSWSDMKEHVTYTYDEQGRLIEKVDGQWGDKYVYTYDSFMQTETYLVGGSTEMWTKTYIFMSGDQPDMMESTGMYETYNFSEYYYYDEEGRLTEMESTYNADSSPKEKVTYEYDERDMVVEKVTYVGRNGVYEESSRELREYMGNGQYKIWTESYDETDGWYDNGIYSVERYVDLNPQSAPQNVTVENVSTADAPNSVVVTAQMNTPVVPNAAYVLYRGWQAVDTVAANGTTITFTDANVVNGTYEYIVQSVDSVSGYGYNVSDPAEFVMDTELPEVALFEQLASTEGEYSDPQNGMTLPVYWVHFKWEAPATDFEVLEYRIYQDGQPTPTVVHTDMTSLVDSVWVYREVDFPEYQQTETELRITVVYSIGESAGYEIPLIVDYSSVADVRNVPQAYVVGRYLYVAPAAEVSIYNAGGMLMGEYCNSERVDLGNLSNGIYVVRVKVGENVQVVKIAR